MASDYTVKIELPENIYHKARLVAEELGLPIEEIVLDWIHPPGDVDNLTTEKLLVEMEDYPAEKLFEITQGRMPDEDSTRLKVLLAIQPHRELSAEKHIEIAYLIQKETNHILWKNKAVSLLKEREKSLEDQGLQLQE